jgi:hypothetical protein
MGTLVSAAATVSPPRLVVVKEGKSTPNVLWEGA